MNIENILLEQNIITKEQLFFTKEHLEFSTRNFVETLNDLDICSEIDVLHILKKVINEFEFSILKTIKDVKDIFNKENVKNYEFNLTKKVSFERNIVFLNVDDNYVYLLISNPNEIRTVNDTIRYIKTWGKKCIVYASTFMNLSLLQNEIYSDFTTKDKIKSYFKDNSYSDKLGEILSLLIEQGTTENASDIFIVTNKNKDISYIFFRVNRVKEYRYVLKTKMIERLSQFVLQKANMEIGQLNGHQDGGLGVEILNKRYTISLRLNQISTVEGNQITIRLQNNSVKLDTLDYLDKHKIKMREVLKGLKGIVILAGGTGSGKTTTLYAMMNEFDPYKYNIITMEDPVEIKKIGINQIQINNEAKQSFKESIRACMRQAPDIIMLGEIRDLETAERAIEASNTGHLVLATIHSSGVLLIEERLRELGMENTSSFLENVNIAIFQELKFLEKEKKLVLNYEFSSDLINKKVDKLDRLIGNE